MNLSISVFGVVDCAPAGGQASTPVSPTSENGSVQMSMLCSSTSAKPNGGPAIKVFEGRVAQEVAWQITDWKYLTDPGHLMYVGLELQKAEEAIKHGTRYEQDPA